MHMVTLKASHDREDHHVQGQCNSSTLDAMKKLTLYPQYQLDSDSQQCEWIQLSHPSGPSANSSCLLICQFSSEPHGESQCKTHALFAAESSARSC